MKICSVVDCVEEETCHGGIQEREREASYLKSLILIAYFDCIFVHTIALSLPLSPSFQQVMHSDIFVLIYFCASVEYLLPSLPLPLQQS